MFQVYNEKCEKCSHRVVCQYLEKREAAEESIRIAAEDLKESVFRITFSCSSYSEGR